MSGAKRRLYRTDELLSMIKYRNRGFGVAHVWFQCYDKRYFEKCPKQYYFRH